MLICNYLQFIFSHNKPIMLVMHLNAEGGNGKSFEKQQPANDGGGKQDQKVAEGNGGVSKGGKRRGEEEGERIKACPIIKASRQHLQAMEGWGKEAMREGEDKKGDGTSATTLWD